jgi:hypothetical protein
MSASEATHSYKLIEASTIPVFGSPERAFESCRFRVGETSPRCESPLMPFFFRPRSRIYLTLGFMIHVRGTVV